MHQTILLRTTILVWTTEEKLFKRFLQPLTSYPLLSSALYPKLTVNGLSWKNSLEIFCLFFFANYYIFCLVPLHLTDNKTVMYFSCLYFISKC